MIAWLKGAWRSRTMWAAAGLGVFGVAHDQVDMVRAFISPELYGKLMIAIALGVGFLRAVTTASLVDKAASPAPKVQ
jgi:hypothetical protein